MSANHNSALEVLIAAAEPFGSLLFDPQVVTGTIELEIDPRDVERLQAALTAARRWSEA